MPPAKAGRRGWARTLALAGAAAAAGRRPPLRCARPRGLGAAPGAAGRAGTTAGRQGPRAALSLKPPTGPDDAVAHAGRLERLLGLTLEEQHAPEQVEHAGREAQLAGADGADQHKLLHARLGGGIDQRGGAVAVDALGGARVEGLARAHGTHHLQGAAGGGGWLLWVPPQAAPGQQRRPRLPAPPLRPCCAPWRRCRWKGQGCPDW
jgi:hypothetical protein